LVKLYSGSPPQPHHGLTDLGESLSAILMSLTGEEIFDLVFLLLFIILVPSAGIYAHRRAKQSFAEAEASLRERGYAKTQAYQKNRGHVTWIWSLFPEPVPLYLRVSNRDPIELMAARIGIKDIKTGDRVFDAAFVVHSNDPERAVQLLDANLRQTFLQYDDIDFLTGAMDNLLSPDFWPKQKQDRNLRTLWMVRVDGELDDTQCEPYLTLGRLLAARILQQSKKGVYTPADYRIGRWEGR
jgi:hypothetical protein